MNVVICNGRQSTGLLKHGTVTINHKINLKSIHYLTDHLISICINCSMNEMLKNKVFRLEGMWGKSKPMYFFADENGMASTLYFVKAGLTHHFVTVHAEIAELFSRTIKLVNLPKAQYQFFIGDENAIGIFDCILKYIGLLGKSGIGVLLTSNARSEERRVGK